jgi:asparagine synthase (glutamine-hydrolysing)
VLEKIARHFDEPFADASAVPTWYVCEMARRKVTVALSGDGGDETFAGYVRRYGMTRLEDGFRRRLPGWFRAGVLGPAARFYPRADTLPRPLRLKRFLGNLSRSFEEAYVRDMSFCFSADQKRLLYADGVRTAMGHFDASEVLGRHIATYHGDDPVTRAQYVDIKTYLPEDILVKVDRMSMAHSLEVRAPILDHKLMEFAARLPSSWKLRGSESKYVFKKMNEDRLPADVLYRKKQGFSIPLASWLRGDLREYARETLFSPGAALADYFEGRTVRRLWEGHQSGREDNATPLWSLLMFGLWRRNVG